MKNLDVLRISTESGQAERRGCRERGILGTRRARMASLDATASCVFLIPDRAFAQMVEMTAEI